MDSEVSTLRNKGKGPRPDKVQEVADLRGILESSKAAILADFRGWNVKTMSVLRRRLREAGATFRVVKNTLIKLAAQGLPAQKLVENLEGPTGIAYTQDDPVSVAKAIAAFVKEYRLLAVKGGLADGEVLGPEQVQVLAATVPRPVLIAQLIGGLQSPVSSFVGTLQQLYGGLVLTLQGVADSRQR
jgi:large subunit ribosomal protein L10